jgi:hypothetical protein
MISNLSLSAFSAADVRPVRTPPPPAERAPVDAIAQAERVRAQAETPAAQKLPAPGATTAPTPGRPMPRGSLLDLSV